MKIQKRARLVLLAAIVAFTGGGCGKPATPVFNHPEEANSATTTPPEQAPAKVTQWEYSSETMIEANNEFSRVLGPEIDMVKGVGALNKAGAEGWEAFAAFRDDVPVPGLNAPRRQVVVLMRRPSKR